MLAFPTSIALSSLFIVDDIFSINFRTVVLGPAVAAGGCVKLRASAHPGSLAGARAISFYPVSPNAVKQAPGASKTCLSGCFVHKYDHFRPFQDRMACKVAVDLASDSRSMRHSRIPYSGKRSP